MHHQVGQVGRLKPRDVALETTQRPTWQTRASVCLPGNNDDLGDMICFIEEKRLYIITTITYQRYIPSLYLYIELGRYIPSLADNCNNLPLA